MVGQIVEPDLSGIPLIATGWIRGSGVGFSGAVPIPTAPISGREGALGSRVSSGRDSRSGCLSPVVELVQTGVAVYWADWSCSM